MHLSNAVTWTSEGVWQDTCSLSRGLACDGPLVDSCSVVQELGDRAVRRLQFFELPIERIEAQGGRIMRDDSCIPPQGDTLDANANAQRDYQDDSEAA
jgi:hypothetical protein